MTRFAGKCGLSGPVRALALGGAVILGLAGTAASAEIRRDDRTLVDIEHVKAVKQAKAEAGSADGPIIITPASTTSPADEVQQPGKPPASADANASDDSPDPNANVSIDNIQVPSDLTEEVPDPLEPVNRVFFGLNDGLDLLIIRPVALVYRAVVPKPVRVGVGNALRNAATPVILANDILQGADGKRVEATVVRFMLNSTIGIGGLVDVGSYVGLDFHREDFGQTLATWGVGSGPYMVAPILGPGNPRDFVGVVVDTAINPLTWLLADEDLWIQLAPSAAEMISTREVTLDDVDALRKTSPDFYVTVRQLYGEKRKTDIANGDVGLDPIPGTTSLPPSQIMTPTVNPF